MKIGQKCKINNDSKIYKVTDSWVKKRIINESENSIEYENEIFVNLEEVSNPENIKTKISTVNVYSI